MRKRTGVSQSSRANKVGNGRRRADAMLVFGADDERVRMPAVQILHNEARISDVVWHIVPCL